MSKLVSVLMVSAIAALPTLAHAKTQSAQYTVSSWSCEGCAAKSAKALKQISGVTDVKTHIEKKELVVIFDDEKVKEAEIAAAVKKLKFDCE